MESELGAKTSKRCSAINQPQALQSGFLLSPRKRPRRQPQPYEFPSKDGDGVSRFVAKDLRIKRVFSRNLPDGSGSSGEQISDKEGLIIANGSCPNEDEGVGKISETPEVRNLDVCNSSGFVEQRFDGKSEELGHSTPPDAEILAVASSDGCPRSSNTYAKVDTRMYSVTRTGSVLKPCLKRKLFKAPGSLAYKRLLPFLLDSDNYTVQGDPYPKRESNLEKKPNIESNLPNHDKELCFVDSDTCVKKSVFISGMSCKATKPNLAPPDNRDTKSFQNGNPSGNQKCSDSNNELNLVKGDSGLKKDDAVCASSHDKVLTENGGLTKHHIEHVSYNEQSKTSRLERIDGGNSFISSNVSSEVENSKLDDSKKLSNNVSEDIEKEDYVNKELQMSSLDANISCYPIMEERRDEKVECTRGADQTLGGSTIGENHSNMALESDKEHGSLVRNKSVRNPLVQLKQFAGQVSVSYRRMLPFLEDLFKDNSENCVLENIDCPRPDNELATMHLQQPSSDSHNSLDKSEGLVSCNKPCDGNSDTLSKNMNETVCETEKILTPAEVNDELLSPSKLQMHQLHSEQMLDEGKMEMDPQLHGAAVSNDQAVSSSNPSGSYEPLTGEDCTSLTDNVSDGAKLSDGNSLGPNSSGAGACILPENCINVKKGILKRNPRGCRGICTCLNCSSFRLHAERAFEFSRNQLQDAEEVASDLMKELSFLRDVLERFSDGVKGDAGYHSTKVKEACRKAAEAELIAKDRFLQMNYELDIHCRITCSQRPSVRFSCDIEKKRE